jgi:hypothetical protein
MPRNLIGGRGSGGRLPAGTPMPQQFGSTPKVSSPTAGGRNGTTGHYPEPGEQSSSSRTTGRYPRTRRTGRYPN